MLWTAWLEQLDSPVWTANPTDQSYQASFVDMQYMTGQLLESWEFPTPNDFVMHVRHGIYWQNISPANGREFDANDIVFHFDRMLGLGDGYTAESPFWTGEETWLSSVQSITATDQWTVDMKWKTANPELVTLILLQAPGAATSIENPEAVKQWGDVTDWHHAIGTGPFILQDYVSGSSATMVKNPNYWQFDERYPENRLPYIDKLTYLIIPDDATAVAALRSGKLDELDNVAYSQVQDIQKTNPKILVNAQPSGNTVTVDPRNDLKPFSDINVRIALQEAMNLPQLASSYYQGTCSPDPSTMTSNYMTGWGWPYDQWPQALKDEYAYNPTNAKQLLANAGYPTGFNTTCIVDNASDLNLVQIVQSMAADIGINMSIQTYDSGTWNNYVITNHKNTGLAIRAYGSLGFNFSPNFQFGRYIAGGTANYMMINDPKFNTYLTRANQATTEDAWKALDTEECMQVAQQHVVISLLLPNIFSLYQPWLKGFSGQYGATWGFGGPELLYFYAARFWVDQSLK